MSRIVASVVLDRRFGSAVRKSVALVLADHADGDQWATVVGQRRIAAEAEVGERTVRRVLTEFEEEGLIVRRRRHRKDGTRTSDEVVLVREKVENLPAALSARPPASQAARTTGHTGRSSGDHRPHRPDLPAIQAEPTGQSLAAQEPSVEPSGEPPSLRSGQRDLIFEALIEACFGKPYDPGTRLTSRERGILNRATKELKSVDATHSEIVRRAGHFLAWVGQLPTPDNLVTHWNRLARPQQRATQGQLQHFQLDQDRKRRRQQIVRDEPA